MKVTNKKSNTSIEFNLILDANDLEPARLKALERLARDVKIPGFRNGKAPANIVEQHVNPNDLAVNTLDTAIRDLMPKVFATAKAIKPIAMPHVDVAKYVPGEMAEVNISVEIMPEVKLCDWRNLDVDFKFPEVKDEDVEDVLKRIANNFADHVKVDRKAKLGDIALIDFKGKKDGVAFDGGTASDYSLSLGSGQFIPGFEEAIVGHKAGEDFDINLSFPEDYGVKDLAGQAVVFEIKLKEVQEAKQPEINDELAKKTGAFEKLDDLKADIRANLESQYKHGAEEDYRARLIDALIDKSEVEAPASLVEEQFQTRKEDIARNLKSQHATLEEALAQNKLTKEQWEDELHQAAERRVKGSILIQAITEELKIEVSDEELEVQLDELKRMYDKDPEARAALKSSELRQDVRNRIRVERALTIITDENRAKLKAKAPAKAKASKAKADKASEKKATKKSSKKTSDK